MNKHTPLFQLMYVTVFLTHAHTHTHIAGLRRIIGGEGGGWQDKQSSKKHSSDPFSWWVALLGRCATETAARFPKILHSHCVCPRRAALQSLSHFCGCWTFLTTTRWSLVIFLNGYRMTISRLDVLYSQNESTLMSLFFCFQSILIKVLNVWMFPSKNPAKLACLHELDSTIHLVCV